MSSSLTVYYVDGDTQINSQLYHKVYHDHHGYTTDLATTFTTYGSYLLRQYDLAFRQDISAQKIYFVPAGADSEYLFLDFSVKEGDVFTFPAHYSEVNDTLYFYTDVVETVDIIQLKDGSNRKRIKGSLLGDFIEGVGSTRAFVYPYYDTWHIIYNHLACMSVNGMQVYGEADNCCDPGKPCASGLASNPDEISLSGFQYGNNIALKINNKELVPLTLSVVDAMGRTRKSYSISYQSQVTITIEGLSSGLYFATLSSEGEIEAAFKFMVF